MVLDSAVNVATVMERREMRRGIGQCGKCGYGDGTKGDETSGARDTELVGCLVGWLVGCLVGLLVGWLAGWLVGLLVGWLVCWMVGCLVGR